MLYDTNYTSTSEVHVVSLLFKLEMGKYIYGFRITITDRSYMEDMQIAYKVYDTLGE
jgi:hypothetical protein